MTREEMLDQCKEIVTKHRQSQYGTPEDNFGRIAQYWSTYLERELKTSDVAMMMVLLKIARGQHKCDNIDTWVDIAGYAACGCEVSTSDPSNRDLRGGSTRGTTRGGPPNL